MKKFLFLAVCAAGALTACTSEDVVYEGVQGNAIGFESIVNKNSRAVLEIDNDALTDFYVYGYYTKTGFTTQPVNVFDGVKVSGKKGSAWTYTGTRYWVPDTKYYFYAYSCANNETANAGLNLDGANTVAARALTIGEFKANTGHQHDLVFASNDTGIDGSLPENVEKHDVVPFTFKHVLSRVNIVFSSDFPSGYEITVSNVKFENIYDQGDYNPYTTPVWSNVKQVADASAKHEVEFSIPTTGNVAAAAVPAEGENAAKPVRTVTSGAAFVIPYNYTTTKVRLVFDIEVRNTAITGENSAILGTTLTGSWTPNWVSGTSYTYNVKIAGSTAQLDPIVFESANVDGWDDATVDPKEVDMTFSAN